MGGGGKEKRGLFLSLREKSLSLQKKEYANCLDRPVKHAMDC